MIAITIMQSIWSTPPWSTKLVVRQPSQCHLVRSRRGSITGSVCADNETAITLRLSGRNNRPVFRDQIHEDIFFRLAVDQDLSSDFNRSFKISCGRMRDRCLASPKERRNGEHADAHEDSCLDYCEHDWSRFSVVGWTRYRCQKVITILQPLPHLGTQQDGRHSKGRHFRSGSVRTRRP
jgi:hypothetical protein